MFKKIVILSLVAGILFLGSSAFSAGFGLQDTAKKAGYQTTGAAASVTARIQSVVSAVLGVVALLFFGLTLYGGFVWLTARGKEDKVASAKAILEAAAIGLVVIASSYALSTFILSRISQSALGCCSTDAGSSNITKTECDAKSGSWSSVECPTS